MFHNSIRMVVITATLTLALTAKAEEGQVWVEYPESGVVLGQGYNLLEDRPATGTCVDFVPVQDPSQSVQYKFDEVTSQTQVQSVTNISASGSMKMAILKASARLSFLSDESFKLETQKFLLSANVVNSSLFAAPSVDFKKGGAVVRQPAGKTEDNKDYQAFTEISMKQDSDRLNVEKCGQGFVAAIVSGASLDAFLTMAKSDAKSLAEIKGGLEADIGGIFTVSGSFEQKQTAASVQRNTSVSVYKTGGNSSTIAYDLAGLKASVASMPLEAATAPKPIRIAVLPYEFLDSFPVKKSYTAQLYGQAISGYFLARDVFQRTSSIIEMYEGFSEAPTSSQPIYLKKISTYLDLNARAMKSTNQLSKVLELCQQQITRENADLGADISAAAATPPATRDLSKILGVSPSDEGQRIAYRAQNSHADLPALVDNQFTAITTVAERLSALPNNGASNAGQGATDLVALCSPNKNDSFLYLAVDEAIALAAEEISSRPIFWSDLGPKTREKLKPIVAQIGGTSTIEQMTEDAQPFLQEYNALHRSSLLLRETCEKTFSHPLCSYDYKTFLDNSKISIVPDDIKFTQMQFDVR